MKYNNKNNISQNYGQSVYVVLYSKFTCQCNCFPCIIYFFMQASDCVIIYLNKNKFCAALSIIYDIFFLDVNKQKCYFDLFGRNKFFRL